MQRIQGIKAKAKTRPFRGQGQSHNFLSSSCPGGVFEVEDSFQGPSPCSLHILARQGKCTVCQRYDLLRITQQVCFQAPCFLSCVSGAGYNSEYIHSFKKWSDLFRKDRKMTDDWRRPKLHTCDQTLQGPRKFSSFPPPLSTGLGLTSWSQTPPTASKASIQRAYIRQMIWWLCAAMWSSWVYHREIQQCKSSHV